MFSARPESSPRKRKIKLLLWSIGLSLICLYVISRFARRESIISPLPDGQQKQKISILSMFHAKKNPDDLRAAVKNIAGNTLRNYSVYVKDLSSDFQMDINESVIYTAASVNKIPILAALYYYVQKGDASLDQDITLQQEDIQDYGTGSIRYDPPGTVYSVKTLAQLMIQKSDNTAAYLLANQILTVDKIQSLINSWGLTQTDIVNNKTSNKDCEIILEKIYSGGVANQAYTQEMLSFLSDSDFEDRIPAQLPQDVTVYHKIGTEVNTIHDVGIVIHGKTKYYIGIFSTDVANEDEATKTIATISKKVYDFMQ